MLNLNEEYFSISERCGRNHQNKFCLRPLKGRFYPWELRIILTKQLFLTFQSRLGNILDEQSVWTAHQSVSFQLWVCVRWKNSGLYLRHDIFHIQEENFDGFESSVQWKVSYWKCEKWHYVEVDTQCHLKMIESLTIIPKTSFQTVPIVALLNIIFSVIQPIVCPTFA